jgi:hypothetical protein
MELTNADDIEVVDLPASKNWINDGAITEVRD